MIGNKIDNLRIAVLIPCYNEGLTINKVVEDFRTVLPQASIYVYDNNSTDNTIIEAKRAKAIVRTETRQGKGAVVLTMFREVDADCYILVDGDDTYPAKASLDLLECMKQTNADMVIGDRISNKTYVEENKRPFHNLGNKLVCRLINNFFHSNLNDILSGYRLFSKRFIKNYTSLITGFELETDLTIYSLNYSFRIEQVSIVYRDRPMGSISKLSTFRDGYKVIKLFLDLYRLYKPISFFSLMAFFTLLSGLILGIFPIVEYLDYQYVYKVPTLIAAITMIILSVLLFTCGLILDNISKFDRKNFKHALLINESRT